MNFTVLAKRIQKETEQLLSLDKEDSTMFKIRMVDDNCYHWIATIYGPKDSLYYGYEFENPPSR